MLHGIPPLGTWEICSQKASAARSSWKSAKDADLSMTTSKKSSKSKLTASKGSASVGPLVDSSGSSQTGDSVPGLTGSGSKRATGDQDSGAPGKSGKSSHLKKMTGTAGTSVIPGAPNS